MEALVLVHQAGGRTRWAFRGSQQPETKIVAKTRDTEVVKGQLGVEGVGLVARRAMMPGEVALTVEAIAYEIFAPADLAARSAPIVLRCRRCGLETADGCCGGPAPDDASPSRRLAAKLTASDLSDLEGRTLLEKLARNVHSIADDELREVGIGLFRRPATAANHSCVPNVYPRFSLVRDRAPRLEYVVLRDIRRGDELRHEYVDAAGVDRRQRLRRGYGFTCACSRCFADEADDVPRGERLRLDEARRATEDAIEGRDFFAAAVALAHIDRDVLLKVYGSACHPQLGLYHLRRAKCLLAINEPEEAMPHLHHALGALRLSHGVDSRLCHMAQEILRGLEEEAIS